MRGEITRRGFVGRVLGGALGISLGHVSCASEGGVRPPNIVVLLTDDQRADSLGCMGNPIVRTPHIDRLAQRSAVFDNCFVTTSICAASRASIFSGQYTSRHGIDNFGEMFEPEAFAQTYPLLFRAAGYRVGFVGKWGLGGEDPRPEFDYFRGFPGQGDYLQEVDGEEVHLTQLIGAGALGFLASCKPEQPFCLTVSFKAPHGPLGHSDPSVRDWYDDVQMPMSPTATMEYALRQPEFIRETEGWRRGTKWIEHPGRLQNAIRRYYRLVSGADRVVGDLLAALAKRGFDSNTIILFASDNGFFLGEHGLRGKWLMYEESIRVPLIVHDPRVPASLRGIRRPEMALNVDFAPTLLDLAGVSVPDRMQGASLAPLIRGEEVTWRKEWFYELDVLLKNPEALPNCEGVRSAEWKYIRYRRPEGPYEQLFHLSSDPFEERDLARSESQRPRLEEFRSRWKQLRAEVG